MFGMYGTPRLTTPSEPVEADDNFYANLINSIPTTEQMRSGWRNKGEVQSKTRSLVEMCLEELSLAAFPELTLRKEISVCHYPLGAVRLAYEVLNEKINYVYLRANENGVDRHLIFSAILDPDLEEARPNKTLDNDTESQTVGQIATNTTGL